MVPQVRSFISSCYSYGGSGLYLSSVNSQSQFYRHTRSSSLSIILRLRQYVADNVGCSFAYNAYLQRSNGNMTCKYSHYMRQSHFILFVTFFMVDIKCKLYADDIKLYSCYDVNSSQSDLLVAISRMYNWSCVWQSQIAVEKCFVCTVSITRHNNSCTGSSYDINNQTFAFS